MYEELDLLEMNKTRELQNQFLRVDTEPLTLPTFDLAWVLVYITDGKNAVSLLRERSSEAGY